MRNLKSIICLNEVRYTRINKHELKKINMYLINTVYIAVHFSDIISVLFYRLINVDML